MMEDNSTSNNIGKFKGHCLIQWFVDMHGIVEDIFYQTCRYKLHNKRYIDIENW
jgi:hypothetical protein